MRLIGAFSAVLALIAFPLRAHAYPGFVAHGYTTCATCHYNPLGNGPLTDYGRALGATLVSGAPPWVEKLKTQDETDEKIAGQSGFLGSTELPSWLRPAFGYRGMWLSTGMQNTTTSRWINMQQDLSVTLQDTDAKWIATGTVGYTPPPASASTAERASYTRWLSRENYIGMRTLKTFHLYAGLMDPAYGLRIPEHNAFIRSRESRNMNDQNYGVLLHVPADTWDLFVNPVIGNLQQDSRLRQRGVMGTFELEPIEHSRFGLSLWSTKNDFRQRNMAGLHTRLGLEKNGAGVLAEVSLVRDRAIAGGAEPTTGQVGFVQLTSILSHGLYGLFTFENSISSFKSSSGRSFRAGPTLQWFPVQRLELRLDFLSTRSVGGTTTTPDDYTLLSQVHVWL